MILFLLDVDGWKHLFNVKNTHPFNISCMYNSYPNLALSYLPHNPIHVVKKYL